ncbi:type I site-specific restriction-modification system R (restriction) subunit [Dysgonomonadaceae bacterium PH5-43]|nr:type I site-specific restriction-modification system R (restriction) subunit [Dysgonomonadaceae bacterium PH5-43]
MKELNLPDTKLISKEEDGKRYVFDRLRKQYVRLTPEEYVRQMFIGFLIEYKNYPEGLLANEVCIELGNLKRRCDTVLYNKQLKPVMIIEYKAPSVKITQSVFDQIARYNMVLGVKCLIVTNGIEHYCCIANNNGKYCFVEDIPDYSNTL